LKPAARATSQVKNAAIPKAGQQREDMPLFASKQRIWKMVVGRRPAFISVSYADEERQRGGRFQFAVGYRSADASRTIHRLSSFGLRRLMNC
jgi:hypothetical protein